MKSRKPGYRYVWKDLRDPILPDGTPIELQAAEHTWRHFIVDSCHMPDGSRVNNEWLGKQLCDRLRNAWDNSAVESDRHQILNDAGTKMDQSIRQATDLPLVFVHDVIGAGGGEKGEHWVLPLKPAVRMIVKRKGGFVTVVTCFPLDRGNRRFKVLWQSEIRRIVSRYADSSPDRSGFFLPETSKRVRRNSDGKVMIDTKLRFCHPLMWGFEHDRAGARWLTESRNPPDNYRTLKPRPRRDS